MCTHIRLVHPMTTNGPTELRLKQAYIRLREDTVSMQDVGSPNKCGSACYYIRMCPQGICIGFDELLGSVRRLVRDSTKHSEQHVPDRSIGVVV